LTGKGKNAGDHFKFGSYANALLFIYFIRQALLFILFWPVLLVAQTPNGRKEEKNSAG